MHRHAPTTRAALFFFSLFLLLVLSGAPAFAAAPPYTVKAGDTLWDIAASHNLTVDALVAANHLDAGALLQLGQTLTIPGDDPAAPAADPAPAPTGAPAQTQSASYTIQPGDTLWDIAASHNLTVDALVAANNLDEQALLHAGQTLVLPGAGDPTAASAAPAATPARTEAYTVQAGDTLWDIAATHDLTVDALVAANNLNQDALLQPGQTIQVPAGRTAPRPVAKAPAKPAAAPAPAPAQANASGPAAAAAPPPQLSGWPAALLRLINDQRVARGLPALAWAGELARAAQAHADDCSRRGYGSHVGSDGARLKTRLARAAYAAAWAGENWANALGLTQTFNMWFNEPPGADPHRQNILNPMYHEIGIGVADAGWGYYFIADFGSR